MVKRDGASEKVVEDRVIARLKRNWIYTPKHARGMLLPLQERVRGYYLVTSVKYRKTKGSRESFVRTQTQSKGVPDIAVNCNGWGPIWLGVELKANKASMSLTIEQRMLKDAGMIVVAKDADTVIEAIKEIDITLGIRRQEPWR